MRFGKIFFFTSLILCMVFAVICWCVPFYEIFNIKENVYISKDGKTESFGGLVTTKYNEDTETVDFMLFNAVKIHSVVASEGKKVYLGGDTLGFSYQGDGVLVVANNANSNLETGDIIKSINGQEIDSVRDLTETINSNADNEAVIKLVRKGQNIETKVKPAYDVISQRYKLGVWARDSMSGIGTLTYIDPETGRFGALGHPIKEQRTDSILDVSDGTVHNCAILGVKRAIRGEPGELRGIFVRSNSEMGEVDKNCDCGMYGTLNLENEKFQNRQLVEVGGRMSAHPGKAQIYSSIDGKTIRAYDIEIIKTNYQGASSPKNMIFKVTDNRLISATGGIVQGMSGSPIIQDGKLIGAVTHVFVNDATKGFAIYIDNMLNQ
ncbi:MAG: SpoIVB peptidase [Clostridia bacterium]|nr:SpoIVB peptidase [Clostridia bacterium]